MDLKISSDQFTRVQEVVHDTLRFKAKLSIGEDAYGSLRLKNKLSDCWEVFGAAGTGAAVANSSMVTAAFFAPHGLLGFIGIGAGAATPLGWVVAAAALSGGAVIGVRRFLSDATGNRVTVIPKFINTPIDVLAVSLFDLIAPLALKIAKVDGSVSEAEREWIRSYFVKEWGYDRAFIDAGCNLIESRIEEYSIKEVAETLAEFCKVNPDCQFAEMSRDLIDFLKKIMEADGAIDEREEFAIEKIEEIFKQAGSAFSKTSLTRTSKVVVKSLEKGKESLGSVADALGKAAKQSSTAIVNSDVFDYAKNRVDSVKSVTKTNANRVISGGNTMLNKVFSGVKNRKSVTSSNK